MATVFMKWLETRPQDYERGIRLLTLGRAQRLHRHIASQYIRPGMRVLEIGCGTGALTLQMAQAGAEITAIDAAPAMLAEAQKTLSTAGLGEQVTLQHMDAVLVGERFPPASFDLIVSSLVFSELPPDEQRYVLQACLELLAPSGRLLVADEVRPASPWARLLVSLVRLPLVVLTWLLTRTTTHALRDFDSLLAQSGFRPRQAAQWLGGHLALYEAQRASEAPPQDALPPNVIARLRHRPTLRTRLLDLWALFFRIIPPFPKVRTGLYAIGQPEPGSPVLVTGNYDLTVRRLVAAIDGKVDAWLLVADSSGINVWCGAGGGYFTAEKVIAALKTSRVEEVVDHHALILPQLCANGVDGWRIRQETGWGVHWGPPRAADIPAYLEAGRKKDDSMRWVRFPLKDRLEMVTVTLGFYGLVILLPVLIFWRDSFWQVAASLVGLSYFYAIALPWIPGRDGLQKSLPLATITLLGFFIFSTLWAPMPAPRLFNWVIGLLGLSVFTAGEMQGMSPLMRGEQGNWGWEALAAVILGLLYWLLPLALGWR